LAGLGYANNLAAPTGEVQFFNVGTLNAKRLKTKVQNLTHEIKAMKATK